MKIFHSTDGGENRYYLSWCHGPVGTARLFYRLHRVTGDKQWLGWVDSLTRAVFDSGIPEQRTTGYWNNISQCCGNTGIAQYCIDLERYRPAPAVGPYRARVIANTGSRATDDAEGTRWVQAENRIQPDNLVAQTGFMQGAAGSAPFFLQLDARSSAGRRGVPPSRTPRPPGEGVTSSSDHPALPDRFRIDREIGRGGMAVVYRAHDHHLDRFVAIKVLSPGLSHAVGVERFQREIALMAKLVHPGIVALFDSGEVDGRLYYVMPFVAGETLRSRLTRERRMTVEDAAGFGGDVAEALAYAHGSSIVHRDVKPANIFSVKARRPGGFRLRRITRERSRGSRPDTSPGIVLGTAPLHVPRAGPRRSARRPLRPLQPRLRPLRFPDWCRRSPGLDDGRAGKATLPRPPSLAPTAHNPRIPPP